MQRTLIAVIVSVVIVSGIIGISAAPPPNAQEKIVTHVTNDNAVRALQVFDISQVEKGSQVTSANDVFSLSTNIGDECVLILNESHLNKDEISDHFICQVDNIIPLETKGFHALQTKLNDEDFNIEIKSINSGIIINIPSNDITLDISYLTPTYFALIENGIVKNVIVGEQSFIDTLDGEWIETKHNDNVKGKYAGVGDTFDPINNKFISPQPYPSWSLVNYTWQPPTPYPNDGLRYSWNESLMEWVE